MFGDEQAMQHGDHFLSAAKNLMSELLSVRMTTCLATYFAENLSTRTHSGHLLGV